jgi:glutathione synthase
VAYRYILRFEVRMFEQPSLGVIMDPMSEIHPEKDTTLALLLEAQRRGWQLYYLELTDLFLRYGAAWGTTRPLQVFDDLNHWYRMGDRIEQPLDQFDVLLMRKDPPVDMNYIYATYILEHAESNGTLVVNKPQSLRDANEKLYTTWFPQCMAPTIVSASIAKIKEFVEEHEKVVLKPLDGMGGKGIFKCDIHDPNITVIIETVTQSGTTYCMAQRFIPEITEGDKRIILIDGEPIPYALARVPKMGEFRGNLAAGGRGHAVTLTERDRWICSQVGPTLREKGLVLVGLDVIGDYLTEINVTSPTCVRELEAECSLDIAGSILDCIAEKLER